MKKHLLLSTILGLALSGTAFAEKHPVSGAELAPNQAYSYWMLDAIKSLDPHLMASVEDSDVGRSLFEGLYNEDGDGNLVPGVALENTVSDDLTTYTFKLRADAKWSNGDPVVAQDFVDG